MKPHIKQAQANAKALQTTGFIVRIVCFTVVCTLLFGLYSCMTIAKHEAEIVKEKLEVSE